MKTAIITGASTGLGLECATRRAALRRRDPSRGAKAVEQLDAPQQCTVIEVDLGSLESVRAFVNRVPTADLPPIHAIVCNAGVQVISGTQQTADGFEMTFGVNHLGHFALVQGLLDELARPARIVVVSSGTHDPSKRTGMPEARYTCAADLASAPADDNGTSDGRRRYTTSKLCNLLFTYELDRRLDHGARRVTVNAFDPGLMPGSGLARDYPPLHRLAWRYLLPALRILPQVHSTRTSGANLAALVGDPRFDGATGQYFDRLRTVPSSADSYDREKARDLWETSARFAMHVT